MITVSECNQIFGMCADVASFYVDLASSIFFAATIGFLVLDTFMQRKSSRLEANAHFATLLNEYIEDHSEFLRNESSLNDVDSCETHAIAYIDFFDRIAYLCLTEKIDESIGDYFTVYFSYVQLMVDWYAKTISEYGTKETEERWKYILRWCTKKRIVPDTEHKWLPKLMQKDLDDFYKKEDHKDTVDYFGSKIHIN